MARRVWRKKDLLRQSLLGLARTLGPGQRMPTVAALCESFSVSNSTLDPILRDLEKQGAIIREHGRGIFVSPTIGQKTIGVVFGGDIFSPGFSPFWSLLLGAVRGQASQRDVVPRAYFDIAEGHAQLVEDLEARRLDGLLLLAPQFHYDEAAELRAFGVPLVCFGGNASADWSVTFDWERFLDLAAAELAPTGCCRIGLVGTPSQRPLLEAALRQAGVANVQIDDWSYETWAHIIPGAGTRENCARLLAKQKIARRDASPLPDTLVSLEDTSTRGIITALTDDGLRPGRDIRIVAAENLGSPVLDPWAENLTRIGFDPAECIAAMLALLDTLIVGGTPPENPVPVAPHSATADPSRRGTNAVAP